MGDYKPQEIEAKWQKRWEEKRVFESEAEVGQPQGLSSRNEDGAPKDRKKPKYYVLEMLPYPSGTLHMGHMRNYAIGDVVARVKRMMGFNVIHPMGWDAFGLPAENAAIKNQTHPRIWTNNNIAEFQKVLRRFGFSYDWRREISTCEPEYYRWNQWFFLRMLERGIAYKKKSRVNWCPKCSTVLANEQVVNGGYCWRHEDTLVEAREIEQWFLKTTAYAEQLLDDLKLLEGGWPERVITMQRNWIGKSTGAKVWFEVVGAADSRQLAADSKGQKTAPDSSAVKAQLSTASISELKPRPPKENTQEPPAKAASGAPSGITEAEERKNLNTEIAAGSQSSRKRETPEKIEVFTTRIDTIYGANAIILAPNHPLVEKLIAGTAGQAAAEAKLAHMRQSSAKMADIATAEKDGFFTGRYAVNPFSGEKIPIWVGNFVLMEYGTGAIMAVPAHDERDYEFAKKFGLPVPVVVKKRESATEDTESTEKRTQDPPLQTKGGAPGTEEKIRSVAALGLTSTSVSEAAEPYTVYGISVNSGKYSGLKSEDAIEKMAADAEAGGFGKKETVYRLRDWGISRQRYWGTPIPVIYCEMDGMLAVPDKDLPVLLPANPKLTGEGQSPLATDPEFVNVKCPKCGGAARRETDTMDTFVDSSWYFYRYCDPKNEHAPYDSAKVGYWFPIDQYIGGIEHAILHLMYSRFWCKVMRDFGMIRHSEPVARLFAQGMVLKDGTAMSKSAGNVVEALEMAERYGADTGRLYTLFAAPPEKDLEWSEESIEGSWRFLNRVYRLVERSAERFGKRSAIRDQKKIPGDSSGAKAQFSEGSMSELKLRPPEEKPRSRQDAGATEDAATGELNEKEKGLLRKTHQTLRRVTSDFETRWHFNSAIAQIMELTNAAYAAEEGVRPEVRQEVLEIMTLMLAPMVPHLAEELWEMLGHRGGLWTASWPAFNAELAKDEEVEIVVQVNGRVRGKLQVAAGASQDEVMRLAEADAGVAAHLKGKRIVKVIYVTDKLLNIVVKE